jgi:hypothetical protein
MPSPSQKLSCCHLTCNRPSLPHIYRQVLCSTNVRCGCTTLAYMMEGVTNVTMYRWHEGIAARVSTEIGSCLLKHVSTMSTSATHLVLYSDSCGGQNRNIHLLCRYRHIIGNPNLPIESVDHNFMIRTFILTE